MDRQGGAVQGWSQELPQVLHIGGRAPILDDQGNTQWKVDEPLGKVIWMDWGCPWSPLTESWNLLHLVT